MSRADRTIGLTLVVAATFALCWGGINLAAAVSAKQADRQHALDCAEQGRPVAGCCRSRMDPERISCPLPGSRTRQVLP